MTGLRARIRVSRLAVTGGLIAAAAVAATAASAPMHAHAARTASAGAPVTLADALAVSRRLGPVAGRRTIHLSLGLRGRHAAELARLLDRGQSVSPAVLDARFGPDPARARETLAALRRAGLSTSWHRGDQVAFAEGPAAAVQRLLRVRLERYVTPQGRRFYAPLGRPVVPRRLRALVTGVAGVDDFGRMEKAAIRPGGVEPGDVLAFYDVAPLRGQGLTGAGETIALPEFINPAEMGTLRQDLSAYSLQFKLPAAQISDRHAGWQPMSLQASRQAGNLTEAELDVEVVHAVAPGAKLVVYEMGGATSDQYIRPLLAIARDDPNAIVSNSWGMCESGSAPGVDRLLAQPWIRAQAEGMTAFVASGDSGAYSCGEDNAPALDFPADTCAATSVGGTTIFQSQNGGYAREIAWGNAIGEDGGGGGVSETFPRPAWQAGPGVREPASNGGCQVPDVAGLGDANTGWQIHDDGKWIEEAGTSAAAPLWAGIAALIDQALRQKGLHPIGFANPALYWMGQHEAQLDPKPFHDVTEGNNLLYQAGPGWDFATGWGTPDAVGLLKAWETYRTSVAR